MTGGIAYDGVEGAGGGNIFDGKKFWVAQRVPMRTHFVDVIKVRTAPPFAAHRLT